MTAQRLQVGASLQKFAIPLEFFGGMETGEVGVEASSPSLDSWNCGTIISNQSSSCSSSSSVVV